MSGPHRESGNRRGAYVTIEASANARKALEARGGRLYLWTRTHGVCEGKVTLLEAATTRPADDRLRFESVAAGEIEVFLDRGGRPLPDKVVLELHGRRGTIRAYWNGWAYVP